MKMDALSKSSATSSTRSSSAATSPPTSMLATTTSHSRGFRETAQFANIMVEFEHNSKEMGVDVPDSFIAHTKTPPKYPPPSSLRAAVANGGPPNLLNSSGRSYGDQTAPPALNTRDHLRIERDGNLLNTREGPNVPSKHSSNASVVSPTEQQSLRMKKYQEEITKKNLEAERRERNEQFLRQSIRNSQKMVALREGKEGNRMSGLANGAFVREEVNSVQVLPDLETVMAAATRLERSGSKLDPGVAELVKVLVGRPEFVKAVVINQKLQKLSPRAGINPISCQSQDLAFECIGDLEREESEECRELAAILCREDFEGMLLAHDKIAARRMEPRESPAQLDEEALLDRLSHYTEPNIKVVRIEKASEHLGATVKNEDDAVVVGRIIRGGMAEATGLLHEGDEILEVNEVPLRGKNVNEVCDILASMKGTLTMLVVPTRQQQQQHLSSAASDHYSNGNNSSNNSNNKSSSNLPVMHVKAHIDYDPEDDPYVPCRELGISFMKGDILHVINQRDPHWWQARREGEEESQLPGLIPSASFQQQREAIKHTIAISGDNGNNGYHDSNGRGKSGGGFLCAKKSGRGGKKGRRKSPLEEVDGMGVGLGPDGAEEVIAYEEVALYYPRSDLKRPVVLIGPPNIGRHELRQRLMQDGERFAAAIPHTSRPKRGDETDGQDYHFLSRLQFEQDIISRKFVEHGEYEKAYYGTSLESIRTVVHSEKICVLNLHPQSLKILKNSDLMPFVVFVAPPSMEKLKRWKLERSSEPVNDEELKDIIERAREMEEVYGHYFDMVIIYSDPERAYLELLREINLLEREPQWVPAAWVARNNVL